MTMLIVFPGAGSPSSTKYSEVYSLISRRASDYGFTSTQICTWPGHLISSGDVLSLPGAEAVAEEAIKDAERAPENYVILARSFGCMVALKTISHLSLQKLSHLVLWGPPPYWVLWQVFKKNTAKAVDEAASKGTSINENFFDSIIPFEELLCGTTVRTILATGELDPYSTPAFADYLKAISQSKNNNYIEVRPMVPGVGHEVTTDIPEYSNTLFRS